MNIGLPKEIMTGEGRVALTPEACKSLLISGHSVLMEKGAGLNSGYTDVEYEHVGVELATSAQHVYANTRLIIKVKQPLAHDLLHLRSDHILFSYLHLAADQSLVRILCDIGLTAIPFESVKDKQGRLPLLSPMSQVAGRIAAIRGASLLFKNRGGRGVLLGGVDGSETGRVVVLGAGVAGYQAAVVSSALGAHVDVVDLDENKLKQLQLHLASIKTHLSSPEIIETLCIEADLVIGAVMLAGRRAPVVLKQSVVKQMHQASVIVDIAIDQGGCVEGIRATSSEELSYVEHGVIHTAVPNMPATVARTSSQSLSTAILPYVHALASFDLDACLPDIENQESSIRCALSQAIAIDHGDIVDEVLLREMSAKAVNSTI